MPASLVTIGRNTHVGIDGTKVRASASRHKAISYGRMGEQEARLKAEIEQLSSRAEEADAAEDRRYGADKRGDDPPPSLRGASSACTPFRRPRSGWRRASASRTPPRGRSVDGQGAARARRRALPARLRRGARGCAGELHRPRLAHHEDRPRL